MIKNKIAQWRARQGRNGITKAHLARGIRVSRSYITKLEKGGVIPSSEIMFRIATYFGCRVEDVFQYVPEQSKTE